jgi:hypothetical protein
MMNNFERQVYLSSKIEFRPLGVTNPTDAEVIVEMRKEIARLRISSFKTDQGNSDASTEIERLQRQTYEETIKKLQEGGYK